MRIRRLPAAPMSVADVFLPVLVGSVLLLMFLTGLVTRGAASAADDDWAPGVHEDHGSPNVYDPRYDPVRRRD